MAQIKTPSNYRGFILSYSADIALLRLKDDLVLTNNVALICIDWEAKYPDPIESKATVSSTNFNHVIKSIFTKNTLLVFDDFHKFLFVSGRNQLWQLKERILKDPITQFH